MVIISREEFRFWFDTFGSQVKSGLYHKLNYDQWTTLNVWSREGGHDNFVIEKMQFLDIIRVYPFESTNASLPNDEQFYIFDESFGTFLNAEVDKYLKKYDICSSDSTAIKYNPCDVNTSILDPYACDVSFSVDNDSLTDKIISIINDNMPMLNNEKENKEMMKFDFGPVDSSVHMSMYGMAIKNASGTYVAYDAKNNQIMDVDILNFEGMNKFMYKMPVALNDIKVGDVIVHAKHPVFVRSTDMKENRLYVLDIYDGEEKIIVPTVSPFGFNFVTKVVSLFNFTGSADASNPFGSMLPFLLMNDSKNCDSSTSMALAMAMMNGNADMTKNPMMMWALMGNRTNDPVMLAMMMGGFGANPNGCCGNCSCDKDK